MYMNIDIHILICIFCIYIDTYFHVCIYTYIYTYICMYVCMVRATIYLDFATIRHAQVGANRVHAVLADELHGQLPGPPGRTLALLLGTRIIEASRAWGGGAKATQGDLLGAVRAYWA